MNERFERFERSVNSGELAHRQKLIDLSDQLDQESSQVDWHWQTLALTIDVFVDRLIVPAQTVRDHRRSCFNSPCYFELT